MIYQQSANKNQKWIVILNLIIILLRLFDKVAI